LDRKYLRLKENGGFDGPNGVVAISSLMEIALAAGVCMSKLGDSQQNSTKLNSFKSAIS